jgi:alpha-beta hydrolase superfamily lysophospholipase
MVLYYSLFKKPAIKGVICTSPGLGTGEPVSPSKLLAAKILKTLLPSMTINNGLDVNNLSHNPQVIKDYQEDPLVHPMISAKLAMDMFSNGDWTVENASKFSLPLLLLQGEKDHIVSFEKTKQFAAKVPESLITFKIFPGLYHELHNEYEQEQVFNFILEWINQHC